MTRPTKIHIDLSAFKHNFQQVRTIAPQSAVIAMVKSNGYGHGLERVATALPTADAFGVACLAEGIALKKAGIKNPIVLMEGIFGPDELPDVVKYDFTLIIHHQSHIDILMKAKIKKPLSIWLKINTGMQRLGFTPQEAAAAYQQLMQCENVKKPIGLMTHFAEADSADPAPTLQQMKIFNDVTKNFIGPRSLANSAGILAWRDSHADWVRPGIMLYGVSPFIASRGADHGLQPVMTLSSELIAIHQVKQGGRIGYGGTFECPEDMPIGVVAIGYGDGYPRQAKNGTPVLVNGQSCPLVGRVSMDMITVDLRMQPTAKVGDPVCLWGKDLPVEVIAECSETNAYELLTRITQRVIVQTEPRP